MGEKAFADRRASTGSAAPSSLAASQEAAHKDHFLQLMFFQASHRIAALLGSQHPELATGEYAALRHSTAKPGDRYHLPLPSIPAPIRLDSPATAVMTDLRRVRAVTIDRYTSIDEANRAMIVKGVRALFVVDDAREVQGFITSTDILGERPIQFAQERGIRHTEVMVRDIMTPADRLEILAFHDVERARVGDVIATLRLAGRQHALAVESLDGAAPGQRHVRGIFSLTQIARQLGVPPEQIFHIARTFAEIGAAIAA
jgi:hypothetical protein